MNIRFRALSFALFAVIVDHAGSQSTTPVAPSDTVIRVSVNLVQVDAAVTDSKGRPVTDLKPGDFEVLQDGKPQTITNFSYIAPPPTAPTALPILGPRPQPSPSHAQFKDIHRTIALVVDDLGLTFEGAARVHNALKKYVDTEVQPGDLVAIVRTGAGIGALQQFTTDKRLLYAAIDRVRYNLAGGAPLAAFAPINSVQTNFPLGANPAGAGSGLGPNIEEERQQIFTAGSLGAVRYLVDGLRDLPGRKCLVLFSESAQVFYRGESSQRVRNALRALVDAANRSAVVIYTIDCGGLRYYGLTAADETSLSDPQSLTTIGMERSRKEFDGREGLVILAEETGGLFLHNTNDLDGALGQVVEDSAGYYLLGYHPDTATFDTNSNQPRFHGLKVRVRRAGLQVRSRSGFFGVPDSQKRDLPRTARDQILHALASPFSSGDIHVRLTTLFRTVPKAGTVLDSMLYIDAHELQFTEQPDGTHRVAFDLIAAMFDEDGRVLDSEEATHTLRVKPDEYARVLRSGLVYGLRHPVKKQGAYQVRVAVRDDVSERLGSATQFMQVPDVRKGRLLLSSILLMQDAGESAGVAGDGDHSRASGDDPNNSPAIRVFKPGASITYLYQILNARMDGSQRPELESQVRVFRDGEQLYAGSPVPARVESPENAKTLVGGGSLQLGAKMTPGDYVLQVIVADKLAQQGRGVASQSMDFEVQP
jgi:VWFA-related protein